jgi:hypothetical protein
MGAQLLSAMSLHIELRGMNLGKPSQPYRGIVMEDNIDRSLPWSHDQKRKFSKEDYLDMVDRRMRDFYQYVSRGGVMSTDDLSKTALVDVLPSEEYRTG